MTKKVTHGFIYKFSSSGKISAARKGKPGWNKGVPLTDSAKEKLSKNWSKRPILICDECGKPFRLLAAHKTKTHKKEL